MLTMTQVLVVCGATHRSIRLGRHLFNPTLIIDARILNLKMEMKCMCVFFVGVTVCFD